MEREFKTSVKGRPPKDKEISKYTISMNPILWKQLKIYAIQNDKHVSDLIEEMIRKFLGYK